MSPPESGDSLVKRLLALPAAERDAALKRLGVGSAARGEIPDASVAAPRESELLRPPPSVGIPRPPDADAALLASALETEPAENAGVRIGPYKLLEKIGEGGFGVVWMAEQESPIRRRVALKIIKAGMDTREVIARFEAERQALALMDHPNIARVFDAGATESGRPYFVMELVHGVAITRYCDENRLTTEARLRLFIAVCQAVQHAHQKGVIHRDLKPSNVMVTLHDGVPVPKIIDFGVAKATGVQLTEKTLFTRYHTFLGTPAYTSPEQLEMSGLDVDTRSDVYSLGVLLYELLAGRPPFDPTALARAGLEAMRRTIREVDPPRPSQHLTALTKEDRTTVAQLRSTDAGRLSLQIRGDLDWIVMHCLEKDRTRRYETANNVAADVLRHLENQPVAARPPSGTYRLRKFVQRHKLGVAASAVVAASLAAGLVIASVSFLRERAARARAVAAERAEIRLRQEANLARDEANKRASHTAHKLAEQLLEEGRTNEALAYFVQAARKDPTNTVIGPRLASVLTSRNFLIPTGVNYQCGSRVLALRYTREGRSVQVGTEDGTLRVFDAATGELKFESHLGKPVTRRGWMFAANNDDVFALRFTDNTIGVGDVSTGHLRWSPVPLDPAVLPEAGTPDALSIDEGRHESRAVVELDPTGHWIGAYGVERFWVFATETGRVCMNAKMPETPANWPAPDRVMGHALSPDGTRLVVMGGNSTRVFSLPSGQPMGESIAVGTMSDLGGTVAISSDNRWLAFWVQNVVHLYDFKTAALQRTFSPGAGAADLALANSLEFLPNGRLFTACFHSTQTWDPVTGQRTAAPFIWRDTFHGNSCSADGERVLTNSTDGYARLWSATTGRLCAEPAAHQPGGYSVAISPDGARVSLGTDAGTIEWFRVGRGVAGSVYSEDARYFSLPDFEDAPVPYDYALLAGHGEADVWGVGHPSAKTRVFLGLNGWFVPPPGKLYFALRRYDLGYAVAETSAGRVESWELLDGSVGRKTPLQDWRSDMAGIPRFSPRGDLFAVVGILPVIDVWDLRTGVWLGPSRSWKGAYFLQRTATFSPDGRLLAAACIDGGVPVWEARTGRLVTRLEPVSGAVTTSVRFSPDGECILTANTLGEARVWNAGTGKAASPVLDAPNANDARYSRDGRRIVTWGEHSIRVWDAATFTQVGETIFESAGKTRVQCSPDGARLAVGGDYANRAAVWDVATGLPVIDFVKLDETRPVLYAALSGDGRYLLGSIWDDRDVLAFQKWSVPPPLPPGERNPEWLLQLATVLSGWTVNDAGQLVDAGDTCALFNAARRQLTALPKDAPLTEWGRWFLDESPGRSIAPGFAITPAEAARLAAPPDDRK